MRLLAFFSRALRLLSTATAVSCGARPTDGDFNMSMTLAASPIRALYRFPPALLDPILIYDTVAHNATISETDTGFLVEVNGRTHFIAAHAVDEIVYGE